MYIRVHSGLGDPAPVAVETPLVKRRPPFLVFSRISPFAWNTATMTAALKQQVARVAAAVRARLNTANAIGVIRLVGHTDASGSNEVNVSFGKRRAEAVRDELRVQLQDVLHRVLIEADEPSPGESQPVGNNSTAAGRALNRRVDVYVAPPIPPAQPWPQGKKIDWTVRDPNPNKDPYRIVRGIPDPLGGRSVRQFLMDVCGEVMSKGKCETLVDGALALGCKGIEALLGQLGGRINTQQKEEVRKRCKESANKKL